MERIENTGGEGNVELDPKRCQHIKPDGSQCQGWRGASGYCAGHARSMSPAKPQQVRGEASGEAPQGLQQAQEAAQAATDLAQASLTASAAAWLADPKTQRRLRRRWDQILDQGADSELIRLVKELTDRVEGRASEARPEEELTVPASVEALRLLSSEQRRALLLSHARH